VSEPFEVEPVPVVATVATVAPRKRNPLDLLLIGAAAVALAGVAFAGGRLTAPVAAATTGAGAGAGTGAGAGAGAGRFGPGSSFRPDGSFQPGGGLVGGAGGPGGALGGAGTTIALTGSVVSVSSTELILQLTNGSTVTIPIDGSTAFHTQGGASSSDVKTGLKVQVEVSGAIRGPGGAGGAGSTGGAGGTAASPAPSASAGTRQLGPATSITIIPE
jgi:hypothetical protein